MAFKTGVTNVTPVSNNVPPVSALYQVNEPVPPALRVVLWPLSMVSAPAGVVLKGTTAILQVVMVIAVREEGPHDVLSCT